MKEEFKYVILVFSSTRINTSLFVILLGLHNKLQSIFHVSYLPAFYPGFSVALWWRGAQ
jgi:hypothetical protein